MNMTDESSRREVDVAFLYRTCVDKFCRSPTIKQEEKFLGRVSFLVQDGNMSDKVARDQAFKEAFGG